MLIDKIYAIICLHGRYLSIFMPDTKQYNGATNQFIGFQIVFQVEQCRRRIAIYCRYHLPINRQ